MIPWALCLAPAAGQVETQVIDVPEARLTLSAGASGSVGALVAPRDGWVAWLDLPIERLPEASLATVDGTVLLVARDSDGTAARVLHLDPRTAHYTVTVLADQLPPGATLAEDAVTALCDGEGARLLVPLTCGSVAIAETAIGSDGVAGLNVCSVLMSPRVAVGMDGWIDRGRDLFRSGDLDAAMRAFESAVEVAPEDPTAYRALADFLRRAGQPEQSLACLRRGIDRVLGMHATPGSSQWRVGTPVSRLVLEHVEMVREVRGEAEAASALDEALMLYPCMEEAVLLRAELLLSVDEVDAAIDSLRSALRSLDATEDVATIYHDVGRFLRRRNQPDHAMTFLEDAWALGDRSEFLLRALSEMCAERGDFDRAADWLTRLAERWRQPDDELVDEERRRRAAERLERLDHEIADLYRLAALPNDSR